MPIIGGSKNKNEVKVQIAVATRHVINCQKKKEKWQRPVSCVYKSRMMVWPESRAKNPRIITGCHKISEI